MQRTARSSVRLLLFPITRSPRKGAGAAPSCTPCQSLAAEADALTTPGPLSKTGAFVRISQWLFHPISSFLFVCTLLDHSVLEGGSSISLINYLSQGCAEEPFYTSPPQESQGSLWVGHHQIRGLGQFVAWTNRILVLRT